MIKSIKKMFPIGGTLIFQLVLLLLYGTCIIFLSFRFCFLTYDKVELENLIMQKKEWKDTCFLLLTF